MHLDRALNQINEIHGHLSRASRFRGLKVATVGSTSLLAILGALLFPAKPWPVFGELVVADQFFIVYWLGFASLAAAIVGTEVGYRFYFVEGLAQRRVILTMILMYAPAAAAGSGLSAVFFFTPMLHGVVPLLPAIWSILHALGLFAARPSLPRVIGWVALFYLAGGLAALTTLSDLREASLATGLIFAVGQALTAFVFLWDKKRES